MDVARGFLRVAVVALVAHALLYRSFLPGDAAHGYFGWYEPLVGGLSVLALVVFAAVALARLLGRDPRWLRALAGERRPEALESGRLAALSVAFLVGQETLERSLQARTLVVAQLRPAQWAVVLVVTIAAVAIIAFLARGYSALLRAVAAPFAPGRRAAVRPVPRRPDVVAPRRHPLAAFRGLRAPPALAG